MLSARPSSAALLLAALALLCASVHASTLDYNKVQLIDYNNATGNFLFRGNEPIINGTFAYDELTQYMAARANNASIPFPSDYYLIDISFINRLKKSEREDLQAETKFFETNPSLGELAHHFLMGVLRPPSLFRKAERMEKAASLPTWMVDELPQLEENVHAQLSIGRSKPVVMYAHCEAGTDRTGEFSGGYYMRFQNMSLAQAEATNEGISGRAPNHASQWATQWYCLYLTTIGMDVEC
eukprot:TRINITY_DN3873_c0_g1_i2.p1 TRINITY_DN3873_c0_g1~~TRINITY_DN3873_c0_g1_i2.p1  ORF type:complete len:252 (-),score=95.71 TRINITY_DN3873_c0_g1_i2:272-991(-)